MGILPGGAARGPDSARPGYDAWLLDGMPEGVWLPLEVIVDTARGEVGEVLGGLGRGLAGGVIRGRGGRARRGKPGPKPHGTR